MAALAGRAHPGLRFHVGSMTSLDLAGETLGGVMAPYSVIHVPDDHPQPVLSEFHRVLVPGGHVLPGFQTGEEDGHLHLSERFGQDVSLDHHWRRPQTWRTSSSRRASGGTRAWWREPQDEETRPRAFLPATKP